jgi:hypothetical protein
MRFSRANLKLLLLFDLVRSVSSLGTESANVAIVIRELCMVTLVTRPKVVSQVPNRARRVRTVECEKGAAWLYARPFPSCGSR